MRLWSLHPQYLDQKGLVALWREALLAQKVLQGKTKGYKHHPQLDRFKRAKDPLKAISVYLTHVYWESRRRCYNFQKTKIARCASLSSKLKVSSGQMDYELRHLTNKCKKRDKDNYNKLRQLPMAKAHPLFRVAQGPVEEWEIIN